MSILSCLSGHSSYMHAFRVIAPLLRVLILTLIVFTISINKPCEINCSFCDHSENNEEIRRMDNKEECSDIPQEVIYFFESSTYQNKL